jgi:O-antigen biosynthesis protein
MSWTTLVTAAVDAPVALPPPFERRPAVSFVVVTYGTGEIVQRCLAGLAATVEVPYEVIVVDNACAGGMPTADRLRLTTSGVRLVKGATNLGFGGGNDVGVAHARADLVCLMNPDVLVVGEWLAPLVAAARVPSVGIAAPVLLHPDRTLQEAGQRVDGQAITRTTLADPGAATVDVDYSSAACWMLRTDVHEAVGGFDPAYHPAYFEDVDLAWRVRRAGWRTVVVGSSRVVHASGTSTRARPAPALSQQAIFRRRWAPELASR